MCTIQTAINDFTNHCKFEKNLGNKTIKAYQTDLHQFDKFILLWMLTDH